MADRPWGSLLVLRRLHRVPDSRTPHITDGRDRGLRDAPGLNLAPTPNRRPPVSDKDRVEGRRPSSDLALSPLGGLDEVSVAASQSDRRLLERVHALVQPVQRGHQPVEQIGELLHVLVELLPGPLSAPLRRR